MITKKYLEELKDKYIGKRISIKEECVLGTIREISNTGQLITYFDNGDVLYLKPEDEFHIEM